MKRYILSMLFISLLCLSGCAKKSNGQSPTYPSTDASTTQVYDLSEIRAFFVPHHMDDSFRALDDQEDRMEKMLTYDEINHNYPVSQLKHLSPVCEYVVYPVHQGGFYYVFLCYYQTAELMEQTPKTTDYLYVYYTAYLGNGDYSEGYSRLDYYKIIPGTTTMADVRQADPNVEHVFLSGGIYTCSLLDDTTVLQIQYGYDKSNHDPDKTFFDAMIVRQVEIKEIENSVSIFSELPGGQG